MTRITLDHLTLARMATRCDIYERDLPFWFEAVEMAFFPVSFLIALAFITWSPKLDR